MKLIITLLLLFLIGCSSVPPILETKIFYKRDMLLKVNGLKGEGFLIVPKADSYDFDIEAKGKLDLFTFNTCHREQTKEKAGQKTWFGDKKRRKFSFTPTGIESSPLACPAYLAGFEIKKGRHSQGFVDFEHPGLSLASILSCNGSVHNSNGVSYCESRAGSIQEIKFAHPVLAPEKNVCIILKSSDEKTFRFKLPRGDCSFRFVTKSGIEKWHRLSTYGYDKIPLRED